jgi:hypothetical protein
LLKHYEVDLRCSVGVTVGIQVAFIGSSSVEVGAFYFDPEEMAVGFYGQVVRGIVAPWFADAEFLFGGGLNEVEGEEPNP